MKTNHCNKLNILFLGGAKRVSFGRKLMAAAEMRGIQLKIFSYELDSKVPVALIGDIIVGRRWNDTGIFDDLHNAVKEYDIDVMLPFVDGAVEIAAEYCNRYKDVWSPVVSSGKAEMLFDKVASAKLFETAGLSIPMTYKVGVTKYPLIAKPRRGSASKGIVVLSDESDLKLLKGAEDSYLLQEYITNRIEYTVDCYISQEGEILCISPRVRLEVVGGEVSKTATVSDDTLLTESKVVIERLGLRGAVTLQFLRDEDSNRLMLMEINPRLGGGVVCSIHAGADIPGMILDEAKGIKPRISENIKPGTLICRYFDEAVFQNGN